jgi:aspartyl-tRNA(Asn)/glutamyl-tRNA(Gln) amidotransferase subunit A
VIADEILYLSVRELGERIRTRQLSPVELTQAYLDRDKKYGRGLNAFAMILPDLALDQAAQAEAEIKQGHYRGPLHGIPYAAKDLLAVKEYPTTWGARPLRRQVFDYDATVIRKLNDAGAILLGKAAMIELAGG